MRHPMNRSCIVLAALFAGLWFAQPASAQIVLPNGTVLLGIQRPLPIGGTFNVGPVVVGPGRRFVRIGGTFNGFIVRPNSGFNRLIFIKPLTANARIRASNFYGAPPARLRRGGGRSR